MMVMVSNHSGAHVGYLAATYPGKLGHLYSPGGQRGPWPFLPYALDNGAFSMKPRWDADKWRKLLEWCRWRPQRPLWVLVPDVVGDAAATVRAWETYSGEAAQLGVPLAFAVQDGMTKADVPPGAEVVFVGGSTRWKWSTLDGWCSAFRRVHVGRVNSVQRLLRCESLGVESIDGTGWFHDNSRQSRGLLDWLGGNAASRQTELFNREEAA